MKTLYAVSSRYESSPIVERLLNSPVKERFVNSPTILNWKIPYIAVGVSGDYITTEDGIAITTESGDRLVTE